jgi:hypothetical protein
MAIRRTFSILACGLFLSSLAGATPLAVNFMSANIPDGQGLPSSEATTLPVLLGGGSDMQIPGYVGDTLFVKFRPEDLSNVETINSLSFTVNFIDDEKDAGESVEVAYALPSSNIIFDTSNFGPLPNNNNVPVPFSLTFSLNPADLVLATPGIFDDGNFRIRLERLTGDFLVTGASAQMDVTYASVPAVPEPATFLLLLPAVGVLWLRRRA